MRSKILVRNHVDKVVCIGALKGEIGGGSGPPLGHKKRAESQNCAHKKARKYDLHKFVTVICDSCRYAYLRVPVLSIFVANELALPVVG